MTTSHVYEDVERKAQQGVHVTPDHMADLMRRFDGVDTSVPEIIDAMDLLIDACVDRRFAYEKENMQRLNLDATGREEYLRLLGRKDRIGEFIHWFGVHATSVITDPDTPHKKVTLELTGTLQFGDWESTAEIDAIPLQAEQQLREFVPKATYDPIVSQDCSRYRYTFFPYFNNPDEGDFSFKHGSVMRWRPAIDILLPKMVHLEVYKRTEAMIIMDQTDDETRTVLSKLSEQRWNHEGTIKNSDASLVAGQVFERAAHEAEGITHDVIPLGAHYFVSAWDRINDSPS